MNIRDLHEALEAGPRVRVEQDGIGVDGTIVTGPSSTGLLKIKLDGGSLIARHVDRTTPLDMNAAKVIYSYREKE